MPHLERRLPLRKLWNLQLQSESSTFLMRELEPSLNTRNLTLTALQNGLRLDSRAPTQTRPLTLSFGENVGCAFVQLGKTKCLIREGG